MAFTDLIVHETGDTSNAVIQTTPPNVVNTPGTNWLKWASQTSVKRNGDRLESGGWNIYNLGGDLDYKITTVWNCAGTTSAANSFYLYLRVDSSTTTSGTYYMLRVGPNLEADNQVQLKRQIAGTTTDLREDAVALTNNGEITIEATVSGVGGTVAITVFVSDGTNSISYTHNDSHAQRIVVGDFFAFRDRNSGHYFDDFKVFLEATGVSGSGGAGLGGLVAGAAGTVQPPDFSGIGAATLAPLLAYGGGTVAAPAFSGIGSGSIAGLIAQGAGAVSVPVFSGIGAAGLGALQAAGLGSVVDPAFSGVAAAQLAALQASGAGTVASSGIVGQGNALLGGLFGGGAGAVSVPVFNGVGAAQLGALQGSGVGAIAAPAFSGSGAAVLAALQAAGAGAFVPDGVVGVAAAQIAALQAAGLGAFTPEPISGIGAAGLGALQASGFGVLGLDLPPPWRWVLLNAVIRELTLTP